MTNEADELKGNQLLEDFLADTRKNHFSKLTQTAFGLPSGGRTRCKLTRIEKPAKTQKKAMVRLSTENGSILGCWMQIAGGVVAYWMLR